MTRMSRHRDPLLQARHDLRGRVFIILAVDFLGRFVVHGSERQKSYARRHTLFVLAGYLCWVEVLRQAVGLPGRGDDAAIAS